ncbi:MAG: hypothetical protein HKN19_02535 [Halioglobus sp.]|nr:hypothetical protein [Halioglobus sp.]
MHSVNEIELGVQGRFHKGADHFYTAISPDCARLFGAPEHYLPEMRWNDFTSTVERSDPQRYLQQDQEIIDGGLVTESEALVREIGGDWVRLFLRRSRAADGGIDGEVAIVPLQYMYNGWLEQLDRDRQVLRLTNDVELTRNELRVLHGKLNGIPQKLYARYEGVSVKAIEKRLHRVREKLASLPCGYDSINRCLDWLGVTQLIVDRNDWFDVTPSFHTYPGTTLRAHSRVGNS